MSEKTVKLGGIEFTIPRLAIKQNRVIEPLLANHRDYFQKVSQEGRMSIFNLTEKQAEDFTRIVYVSISKNRPDLTYEQFEELEMSMVDILNALPTCIDQSGMYKPKAEEPPKTGEAKPGEPA